MKCKDEQFKWVDELTHHYEQRYGWKVTSCEMIDMQHEIVSQISSLLREQRKEFVGVLEGLTYKGECDINNLHVECACTFNKRIDQAIKEQDDKIS